MFFAKIFNSDTDKRDELLLIYLFMNVDGKCSNEEFGLFKDICQKLKVDFKETRGIIGLVDNLGLYHSSYHIEDNAEYAVKVAGSLLKDGISSLEVFVNENADFSFDEFSGSLWRSDLDKNKCAQMHTVWTMINLGYADHEYSAPEKRFVDYLVRRWKINKSLVDTMMDTAETMLSITDYKEWIYSLDKSTIEKENMLGEADNDINKLFKDMETTILEAENH